VQSLAAEAYLFIVNADKEEKGGISPVNDLEIPVLCKGTLHNAMQTISTSRSRAQMKC
jgi:hypothetical protein